ncbi:ATP-binding protein [Asanoa sp. NPDC050611]|uniref:ATP-binding protein n=1 Tax=Asanoa sp. NPDC050611 TaxID=3157098 RepID=UPI0033CB41C9
MSDGASNGPRSGAETVEVLGGRLVINDGPAIIAAAREDRVRLLGGGYFPPPVQDVRYWLDTATVDGDAMHQMSADVSVRGGPTARTMFDAAMLGAAAPLGAMLARRFGNEGPVASRIAQGAEVIATVPSRLVRTIWPPDDYGEKVDPLAAANAAGLKATITYPGPPASAKSGNGNPFSAEGPLRSGPRTVSIRASVPSAEMTTDLLREMTLLVLRVIGEFAGGDAPLRGRTYVIGRRENQPPPSAGQASAASPGPTRTENVTLDHVGGLDTIVGQFREIAVSFRHPDIMARWGARRPQGILLYGPPGTGKTMLARALANEIGATFREIRTPEILDKWLGGSERNIKTIFQEARRYRHPTVMLFDEFDSIISYAGAGGDAASQAVNAVAGIFKQEMNNLIEDNQNVIVVATTNFPHRVDDSLIRSGRFDVKLSIPLPDEAGRAEIFKMKIRDLTERHEYSGFTMFAEDVDPAALAAASHGFSGADVGEVLRRAQLAKAMQEARGAKGGPITQADLMQITTTLRH